MAHRTSSRSSELGPARGLSFGASKMGVGIDLVLEIGVLNLMALCAVVLAISKGSGDGS